MVAVNAGEVVVGIGGAGVDDENGGVDEVDVGDEVSMWWLCCVPGFLLRGCCGYGWYWC